MLVIGFVVGLIPPIHVRYKAALAIAFAIGWAAYVPFGVDGAAGGILLGFALAVANVVIGIGVGMGIVSLVRWLLPYRRIRAGHAS